MKLPMLLTMATVVVLSSICHGQAPDANTGTQATWVFFTDKGDVSLSSLETASSLLSSKTIQRRTDRGTNNTLVSSTDLPVNDAYIQSVLGAGGELRQESRWLNAISINATAAQIDAINALPFVDHTQPVRSLATPLATVDAIPAEQETSLGYAPAAPATFYGSADAQLTQINIPAVHTLGYTGSSVIVGVLDTGFKRTHEAFNEPGHVVDIIDEYDFVNNDNDTSDTANGQHRHGSYILGVVGGYKPNTYVGGAYNASFLLAKTEDLTQEVPAEEDNWVAGLEWLETNGADMVTSSLGYIDWYTQSDLDGETAVTTVAADIAAANGMPIVNAAGNESHDANPATSSIIAPADGNFVITVGAVNSSGVIASFSSDGPSADGRVKPEVLARGQSTYTVNPDNDTAYSSPNGTSLSTPLVASAVALILDAHPTWTVSNVREALFHTAANGMNFDPQYVYGYGVIDTLAAVQWDLLVPGDTDYDDDVDLADLSAFAANWGLRVGKGNEQGDFDYNGINELSDLSTLAGNWGYGVVGASPVAVSTSVPEPAAGLVLIIGAMSAAWRRALRRP